MDLTSSKLIVWALKLSIFFMVTGLIAEAFSDCSLFLALCNGLNIAEVILGDLFVAELSTG